MGMFDLTAEGAFGSGRVEPDEKAVIALLKPPALSYTRELRHAIDKDPNYLVFHEQSVGLKVHNLLSKQGIFWDQDLFERQFPKVVMEAVIKLRGIEK